jgi:hypothetical protein
MAAEQRTYRRGTDEFSRVLAFSDGQFAISMTLLVVGIDIPDLNDADSVRELANALNDDVASFTSFVISFLVVGRYWRAHHLSFSRLAAMNDRLIGLNLLYLCSSPSCPSRRGCSATTRESALGGRLCRCGGHRERNGGGDVQLRPAPRPVERVDAGGRLPLGHDALPLSRRLLHPLDPGRVVSTTVAVVLWFGTLPFGLLVARYKPDGADEFF